MLFLWCQSAPAALLNFKDVEIRQIIESVGELTGKNFLIDNRVRGKVTLISTVETPDEMVYDVMLSVMRMYGFRAVEGPGDVTRIVPANVAPRYSPLRTPDDLVTKIIHIKNLNAASVPAIIQPLMTSAAKLTVHKESNSIIVVESLSSLERVEAILARFDTPSIGSYEIIDLQYMKAQDVVNLIGRARNNHVKHLVTIVADTKFQRVILTGEAQFRLPLRALIAELDQPPTVHKGQEGLIQIVHLNYANAEEMETVLKGLLTAQFLDLAESGSAIVKGGTKPKPAPKPAVVQTTDAKKEASRVATGGDKRYTIQAAPATNSLIIGGASSVVIAIRNVITELDVPVPQVLIEAIIVEITLDKSAALQSQLTSAKRDSGRIFRGPFGTRSDTSPVTSLEGLFAAFSATGPSGQLFGGIRANGGNLSIGLLVTALQTDTTSNVLSMPSILTLNNKKAIVKVGGERSFQTGTTTNDSGTTGSFERRPVATELEVTPQITKGDAIRMEIKQKIKRVNTAALVRPSIGVAGNENTVPTLDREIETNVIVNNRDVVVLGGMTSDEATTNRSKIPLLGDIPLIGFLFRGKNDGKKKLTLMVFIRPTIFRTPEAAGNDSRSRYIELRFEQLKQINVADSMFDEKSKVALPRLQPKSAQQNKRMRKVKMQKEKSRTQKRRVKRTQKSPTR